MPWNGLAKVLFWRETERATRKIGLQCWLLPNPSYFSLKRLGVQPVKMPGLHTARYWR